MGSSWLVVTDVDFIKTVMLFKTEPFPRMPVTADFAEPVSFIVRVELIKSVCVTDVWSPRRCEDLVDVKSSSLL